MLARHVSVRPRARLCYGAFEASLVQWSPRSSRVRHVALPPDELAAPLTRHAVPEAYAQLLAFIDTRLAAEAEAEAEVSDAVERVTGRPPRNLRPFLHA